MIRCLRNRSGVIGAALRASAASWLLIGLAAESSLGQVEVCDSAPGTIAGLPITRPTVPLTDRRASEGPQGQPGWNVGRNPEDRQPTASFVESLKGSDAAFEVLVGQGRILTVKKPIATENGVGVVAIGDPTVVDLEVLPNPRMIRISGRRAGVTDLTVVTADDETYIFEVHVVYDLPLLDAQLRKIYPDALIRVSQFRENIVLEGEARSTAQVAKIAGTIQAFIDANQAPTEIRSQQRDQAQPDGGLAPARLPFSGMPGEGTPEDGAVPEPGAPDSPETARPEEGIRPTTKAVLPGGQVINLMRVPGLRQVMLQVKVAELDRTALRGIGADLLVEWGDGNLIETFIGGPATIGGVFNSAGVEVFLQALRENQVVTVLAEPNVVALDGHRASFLSGGEFPVPVPQSGAATGAITIEWKNFGVQLDFVPTILDDRSIRLAVAPEVSARDETIGIIANELVVPGIVSRRVETTVELEEGQTLVLAGLLSVETTGTTSRIPGLGDLPYIGPLFSSTSHERRERELVVMVTPFFVSPLEADQVPCLPGADIDDPNDLEFYLLNRIEGRRGREFRSTTAWDDPWHLVPLLHLERDHLYGPTGFCE